MAVAVGVEVAVAVAVAVAVGVDVAVGVGVGVGVGTQSVAIVSSHPPAKLPESLCLSSTTYSAHVPFGSVPLKAVNVEALVLIFAGAGAGNESLVEPLLVGLNVPVTNGVVMELVAASSSVRVTSVTSLLLPTSDMMVAVSPPGPTSRMSMSSGKVWDRLLSLTVTFVTVPHWPATTMFEG